MNTEISNTIKILRFPLAVLVVCVHGNIPLSDWNIGDIDILKLSLADVYSLIVSSISGTLTIVAVPMFFFISGYLFFANFKDWNTQVWIKKIRNRVHTLAIPYVLWIFFGYLLIFFRGLPFHHGFQDPMSAWNTHGFMSFLYVSSEQYGYNWLGEPLYSYYPIVVPLWFLRDLIVLTCITPVLYCLLRPNRLGGAIIAILSLAYISGIFPQLPLLKIGSLFMFSFGSWLSLHDIDWVHASVKYKYLFVCVTIVLFASLISVDKGSTVGSIIRPWLVLSMGSTITALLNTQLNKDTLVARVCRKYSSSSFFIYVFHANVLVYLSLLINKLFSLGYGSIDFNSVGFVNEHFSLSILWYLTRITIAIVLSVIIFNFIDKHLPRLSKLMCGGK